MTQRYPAITIAAIFIASVSAAAQTQMPDNATVIKLSPRPGTFELTNGSRVLGKVYDSPNPGMILFSACTAPTPVEKPESEVRKAKRDCAYLPKGNPTPLGFAYIFDGNTGDIQIASDTFKSISEATSHGKSQTEYKNLRNVNCEALPASLRAAISPKAQGLIGTNIIEPTTEGGAKVMQWKNAGPQAQATLTFGRAEVESCKLSGTIKAFRVTDNSLFGLSDTTPLYAIFMEEK